MAAKVCGCGNRNCTKLVVLGSGLADESWGHPDWHYISDDCPTPLNPNAVFVKNVKGGKIYSWTETSNLNLQEQ